MARKPWASGLTISDWRRQQRIGAFYVDHLEPDYGASCGPQHDRDRRSQDRRCSCLVFGTDRRLDDDANRGNEYGPDQRFSRHPGCGADDGAGGGALDGAGGRALHRRVRGDGDGRHRGADDRAGGGALLDAACRARHRPGHRARNRRFRRAELGRHPRPDLGAGGGADDRAGGGADHGADRPDRHGRDLQVRDR